jgi:tRNA uridine 5-carbamoylmethylation protein Kti12
MANRSSEVARRELLPALTQAGQQVGSGMKQRMVAILEAETREIVNRTYGTIQVDLIESLKELEVRILQHLTEVRKEAEKQADIFANNCSVDTDEAANNPQLVQLIKSLPQ